MHCNRAPHKLFVPRSHNKCTRTFPTSLPKITRDRDLQALTPQTNHQTKITPKIYQETLERGKEAMSDLTEMVNFTTYIEKLH